MNCQNCPIKNFVLSDLYCRDCKDKPIPMTKNGVAYLLSRYGGAAIISAEVEAPAGLEYEMSAVELMRKCKIKFEPNIEKEIAELILNGE